MIGTEFIAKILKAEGIDSVTCFPSNPLIEAVAKEGIRPISFPMKEAQLWLQMVSAE